MPSGHFAANGVGSALIVIAHNLLRWVCQLGLKTRLVLTAKTLRRRLLALPGRLTRHARTTTLPPEVWPWPGFAPCCARLIPRDREPGVMLHHGALLPPPASPLCGVVPLAAGSITTEKAPSPPWHDQLPRAGLVATERRDSQLPLDSPGATVSRESVEWIWAWTEISDASLLRAPPVSHRCHLLRVPPGPDAPPGRSPPPPG